MPRWIKLLVFIPWITCSELALVLLIRGERKAAAGAFIVALMISPLLLDAIWPGKYVLRKPVDNLPDTPLNRLKQFRIDHPGLDGTFLLGIIALVGIALFAGALVRVAQAFNGR